MAVNAPSFRLPHDVDGKADPDIVQAIKDHDDAFVDQAQANSIYATRITALEAQVAALQKGT